MRAVAYARYSSANQREESISAQLRVIYDYANKHGINIAKVYVDEAQSATSDNRDDFQRMIAELDETSPDLVLVHKLDRFARDRFDAAFYRREIKKHRARLIAVEQDFGEGPEAGLMESILEGFAEYFSKNLSREVKKGHTENAMQGKHCGGIPPLGYSLDKDGKYIVNKEEAPAIKVIFERKLEGYSYKQIADELNKLGYKTKSGRPFGPNSLHDILRNEKYNGTFVFRKTSPNSSRQAEDPTKTMRIENAIPKIIDKDTFDKVQEIMDKSRCQPRPNEGKQIRYLLTGLIRCGLCGQAMAGDTNTRKYKNSSATYGYYKCGLAKRTKECTNSTRYPKNTIELEVLGRIEKRAASIKNPESMADKLITKLKKDFEKNDRQKELRKLLTKTEKELHNLTNAIASGADPRLLASKLNEAGKRRDQLKEEVKKAGVPIDLLDKQRLVDFLREQKEIKFDRNDEVQCLAAIRKTIKQVLVYPDRTEVEFKELSL
ncbi:MAG TPA: recombinase family protein [Pelotomaculum sp.]|jgi:site-specific DNA recombinase|nr:recombinase family protein [Pelotomaculum sp.]